MAFALIFLPSCSNILEDSGAPSAIAETGKLSLALEADASVSVTTKATTNVAISDEVKDKMVITGTKESNAIPLGEYSTFVNGSKAVPAGTYTKITATYDGMNGKDLAFDSPMLAGEATGSFIVTPKATEPATAEITATLTNSIITIDGPAFDVLKEVAKITKLYVYTGTSGDSSVADPEFSLLSGESILRTDGKLLFVKPNLSNVFIRIEGTLTTVPDINFHHTYQIKDKEGTATSGRKSYNVQYSFLETDGTLKLSISVNGDVEIVDIPVKVNPYE